MKGNKRIKFTFLIMSIISLSLLLTSVITVYRIGLNSMSTSYINKDQWNFIEPNFYKSTRFDKTVLPMILTGIEVDLYGEKNDYYSDYGYFDVESFKNVKFIAFDKISKKYVTNTVYKNIDDFKKNINGYVDISVNTVYGKYTKKVGNKENEINNHYDNVVPNITDSMEVYISIPKNLEKEDSLYGEQYWYNRDAKLIRLLELIGFISSIVFLISTIIYLFIKVEPIDKNSKILKYYSKIPLEIIIFLLGYLMVFMIDWISYPYMDWFAICIFVVSVFTWISCIILFGKQIKYFDKKIDILKTSFIMRFILNFVKNIKDGIKASKKISLIRKIFIIGIGCIIINLCSLIFGYGGVIIVSCIIVSIFTAYILKKLTYLSEIMDGTEKIKNGDLDYKIPIKDDDNFTLLAENINNIGQGLESSIEDALKSERMKAELITNVSHDLKTPLTSIINYIELIKKEKNIEPDYINDYIKVLDSKSKRLKVLIEDLFEASKASSGNLEINMDKIELRQLLRQSIGEMEEKILESNLDIRLNLPEDKVYIYADGRRMYRVLENLLSNIIKYSLNNTRVYIDLNVNEGKVTLIMKNISSYELNFDPVEIMERFKRADESRNTEGSGLGLAIAKDLVNLQGGKFHIEIDGDLFKSVLEFDELNQD